MSVNTTLAGLSQSAGSNGPDGSADAPSTIDDAIRYALSFIAIERDSGHQWGSTVGGTANAITITVNGIGSLVAGQVFRFVAPSANTGAVTLNVNGLGAKNVNKFGSTALAAGDIASLSTVVVTYDGTNFQLANPATPAQTWQDLTASRAAGTTYTNSTGRPILVSASVAGTVANSTIAISWTVGGVTNINSNSLIAGSVPNNTTLSATTVVPAGATYSLAVTQATLQAWRELR